MSTWHPFPPTVVQYSCMGWVILWFLYLPPFPAKKHSWHMSKLKHFRHRYLQQRKCINDFSRLFFQADFSSIFSHRKPSIGFCLHMLHFVWWRAVSAAVNLHSKGTLQDLVLQFSVQFSTCEKQATRPCFMAPASSSSGSGVPGQDHNQHWGQKQESVRCMVKTNHQMGHEEKKTKREKSINPSN